MEQLLKEIYKKSSCETIRALQAEQAAYLAYHDVLVNAFRVLYERLDGMDGSAWPMEVIGFSIADTRMRRESLFCLIKDTLTFDTERITRSHIAAEFSRFKGGQDMAEEYHSREERVKALNQDERAWNKWMSARANVSSTLRGENKRAYDKMTNYIMKGKLLAVNNEYAGYLVGPYYVNDLQYDYTNTLEEIQASCYLERLREFLGE